MRGGAFGAVFAKELVDSLRDHRSILGALIMPIVGPLLFALMFGMIAKKLGDDKPLEVHVIGRDRAPSLAGWLEQQGARIKDAPADPEAAVRDGDVAVVLVFPEDYAERFRGGKPARLEMLVDRSNDEARSQVQRLEKLLGEYARKVASLRLLARGVAPDLASPVAIDEVDLATPQRLAARLLGMIPMFAFLAAFMGGMNVAVDTTAGERERGSLEPLLINPVPRLSLILGKWLVTVIFNVAVALLTLLSFRVALARTPLEKLGISVEMGAPRIAAILAVVVPLALFSAALLMTVSLFARSFKEAQTYLSLLVFVPMFPAFITMVNPLKAKLWMMLVPTFGQNLLVTDLMRGEPLDPLHVAVATLASIAAAAATLHVAARLIRRERIIFGR